MIPYQHALRRRLMPQNIVKSCTLALTGSFLTATSSYVEVNGIQYTSQTTLTVDAGTEIIVYVSGSSTTAQRNARVIFNEDTVVKGEGTYSFEISDNATIAMETITSGTARYGKATITMPA